MEKWAPTISSTQVSGGLSMPQPAFFPCRLNFFSLHMITNLSSFGKLGLYFIKFIKSFLLPILNTTYSFFQLIFIESP